ncbi:MAG: ABC transporter substrate-binding protein [Pseudomonadota bacterium]
MKTKRLAIIGLAALLGGLLWAGAAPARVITDMAGRQVTVPERVTRVWATAPPATYMVYALGPDLLAGLNSPPPETTREFMAPGFRQLPVLGGWFGQGRMVNREALLLARPDVVVSFHWRGRSVTWKINETLEPLGLPVADMVIGGMDDYPAVFRFLGRLCDRQERGEALARYAEETLAAMARLRASLPPEERLTVYYAEGLQGLQTECDSSFHAELIKLCGGVNAHRCQARTIYGMDSISLEQVLAYDPQVILTAAPEFRQAVSQDPRWQGVAAVKAKRIHLIPTVPMNWFDRPPTFMRLMGAHWLANQLYPQRYPLDLAAEAMRFYQLFLGVEIDRATAQRLLGRE